MKNRCSAKWIISLVVAATFVTSTAKADELYARIRGSVNDPSGRSVPGVQVNVTNDATGVTRHFVSGPDGSYELIDLPIGTYKFSATKEGFKTFNATGIILTVNQVYVLDVSLSLGQVSEKVEVQADTIQVETTSMQLGTVVNGQSIVDLPLNGRDWIQLQQLQPGVVAQSDRRADTYATNGSQAQQNSFLINGADSNNFFGNTPAIIPSPDAIAEFRMVTNTLNPEYGRNSGAIVNAIVKSGANQFHGSVFEFYRDTSLNATRWFLQGPDVLHRNQFGGTIGGPLWKDHTFFFLSYQGTRENRAEGIPFEGHVPEGVSVEEASNAGQKTIEHLTGILIACSTREAELLKSAQETSASIAAGQLTSTGFWGPEYPKRQSLALETYSSEKAEAILGVLKRNHTWQCPTLTVLRSMAFSDDPAFTNDPRLKYIPHDIAASWDPKEDRFLKSKTAEDWALSKRIFAKELALVGAMQHAGVEILAGTDTLNPFCFPGFSLHDELGLLVQSGLTPLQALQAATLNPARFLGREKDLGTVEPGKIADLVLLDGSPLDDIGNTRKISAVVFGGKFYSRASLDEMLTKVEALASRKPVGDVLLKTIQEQNVDAAIKQYYALKTAQPAAYDFGESALSDLCDRLEEMKKSKEALRIHELNAEANPSSYTYDSLGEACVAAADKECAMKSFRKVLELSPNDTNATERLKKLDAPSE